MKTMKMKPVFAILTLAILVVGLAFVLLSARYQDKEYKDMQLAAAVRMEKAEAYLKDLILSKGFEIEAEDLNQTALVGPEFTELTTTPGEEGAKRSALNPEFAAAMVRYFHEAGLEEGDSIAIGTSGSFPGFVIATLCAATEMNLDVRLIASLGSSMHGATRVEFNVFDIIAALRDGGFASYNLVGISCGSENDNGGGVLEGWFEYSLKDLSYSICSEVAAREGVPFIYYEDLADSIQRRLELYGDDIRLFINIGGAAPNSGASSYTLDFPQGLVMDFPRIPDTPYRGLNYEYAARGIPVLNLLNVKLLCQENSIPFDPVPLSHAGDTAVYGDITYNKVMIVLTLVLAAIVFALGIADSRFSLFSRRNNRPCRHKG